MSEPRCQYSGDRDAAIVSLIYGDSADGDRAERTAFEAHVAGCDRCRSDLAEFEGVRVALASWSPPEPAGLRVGSFPGSGVQPERQIVGRSDEPGTGRTSRHVPLWAQTAAALLCLGIGAGLANLDVHYGADGLRVRTGWAGETAVVTVTDPTNGESVRDNRGTVSAAAETAPPSGANAQTATWRAELAALEQRLRADIRQASAAPETADVLRRVQLLVDESERRQQRELALRLSEAMREMNVQRQADLVRIDRNIGAMQSNTGREMLRQRSEMLNYVTVRTASQRGQ